MKHFYTLLSLIIVLPAISNAQALVDNAAASGMYVSNKKLPETEGATPAPKTQQWERQQDRIAGHINRNTLEKMKSTTETLAAFLQDSALSIEQYNPVWHGEYFPEKAAGSPLMRFALSCSFYDNTTNRSKADLLIMANDISPMVQSVQLNGHALLGLKPAAATNTDCPYFEFSPAGADNLRLKFWLVSADNSRLPYAGITRREYLQEASAELTALRNRLTDRIKAQTPIRSSAIQEAEKKSAIDEINNTWSGVEREVRMRMFVKNYCSDEDYQKKSITKHTAGLDSTLHLMDSLLHQPAADLNKTAIVAGEAADFQGFADGNADASMLVRLNAAFVNPAIPVEKPQFFLVCWRYNPDEAQAAGLDKQFTHQFNSGRLRDFLGK